MTNVVRRHPRDLFSLIEKNFDPFHNHAIGLETMFGDLLNLSESGLSAFPPHNVRQREGQYFIDLAVAGINKEDLDITLEEGLLTISAKSGVKKEEEGTVYLHRGIAQRAFSKSWRLGEHVKVLDAKLNDGTLTVELEQVVPEGERLRTIEIK